MWHEPATQAPCSQSAVVVHAGAAQVAPWQVDPASAGGWAGVPEQPTERAPTRRATPQSQGAPKWRVERRMVVRGRPPAADPSQVSLAPLPSSRPFPRIRADPSRTRRPDQGKRPSPEGGTLNVNFPVSPWRLVLNVVSGIGVTEPLKLCGSAMTVKADRF